MKRFTAREILLILGDVSIFFRILNVLQTDEKHVRSRDKISCPHLMMEIASDWARLSESALYSSLSLSRALLAEEILKY